MSPRSRRSGLTLIELIVVMAIIVLLGVLLFPWIQQAREGARRKQCWTNLNQLGLALHNYHDAYNVFPPGFVVGQDTVYHGWGWSVLIEPYMDASPLYSDLRFEQGLQNTYNKPNLNPTRSVFRCPSDVGPARVEHASIVTTNVKDWQVIPGTVDAASVFSRSNYFGVVSFLQLEGDGIKPEASGEPPANEPLVNEASLGNFGSKPSPEHHYCDQKLFRGMFGQNSNVGIRNISDGTANTLFVGERYSPRNSTLNAVGHGTWIGVPDCTSSAGLAMTLGDTSLKPNAGAHNREQTTGFGSTHKGGTHFLMGDGSVRFVKDTIDIKIYRSASMIDDMTVLDSDF